MNLESNDKNLDRASLLASALQTKDILTPPEACAYLRVSKSTLIKMTKLGQIPVIRSGHIVRYRKADLYNLAKCDAPSK